MKKVSVIIPVYGVERYIAETVKSVLAQTYENFELLIVDDGSPDRSIEICQKFRDPRIKILRQPNRGLAGARNTGIRQAEGEYVAFLDGDDLWQPEKLAKHVQHLEASPKVGISFSRSAFIDEAGEPLGTYQMPQLTNITPAYLLRCNPIGNGSAAILRRALLEAIQFSADFSGTMEACYFDEQFRRSEDIECWLRIALQTSWRLEGIPEVLTLYRVNADGLSANLQKQLESWDQTLAKVRSYAPDFMSRWEATARAYQLRYLARAALRLQDGKMATNLIHRALATYWRILLEEPQRTLRVWMGAYLLYWLPQPLYCRLETLAAKAAGRLQKRLILQDQVG